MIDVCPENIHFVDNGSVFYSGKTPEKVLSGLLGNDNSIQKIRDFLLFPYEFAIKQFSYESLLIPQAICTSGPDPQVKQFNDYCNQYQKSKIRILDYGAGKGRILENLFDLQSKERESFSNQFDYVAYDEFCNDRLQCIENIKQVYCSWDGLKKLL